MSTQHLVIVGAGQAGFQTAASLRQAGFTGSIALVGDEPGVPYQRPPLSKAYLLGKIGTAALRFRPEEWFVEQRVERVQATVAAIDRDARRVVLADGAHLPYDHLVLATGARNRVPSVDGIDLDGVFGIRTLADADALSSRVDTARNVVVIGAGFIGLEFAAVAAAKGLPVRVIELGQRPMARALSEPMSALFGHAHREWGVVFDFGQTVTRLIGTDGKVTAVETGSGERIPADLVVYGIGVVPNTELAAAANLRVDNGICVDNQLVTSDPAISAIGDAASFPCAWSTTRVRLESVQNAVDQARAVAARLTGAPAPYNALPWFWSDQGDLKLQIAGLSGGHDKAVVIGSIEQRQFSVLCFREGRLIAVESCNRAADHMAARKLLTRGTALGVADARTPGFDLRAYESSTRDVAAYQ
ncbi:NAD(P)/FAD-dependent oxidoreductase [Paraburkholderia dinghuensis]|uniref:Pyridine nucleotide-disulfide oxidoreductase n=1 Tax=Paraburkholderia dinghuensis TaxID=2305225 RepID=A0A3N6N7I7_9BURK|nr:FAD-dependent oxidoreductase [Paraburkholderia dinghuensis]RQH04902.1 pyridine nucleotide-disulfide oxidoreductase [Paraburkholderia dinghuensis]